MRMYSLEFGATDMVRIGTAKTGKEEAIPRKSSTDSQRDLSNTQLCLCRMRLHEAGKEYLLGIKHLPESYQPNDWHIFYMVGII